MSGVFRRIALAAAVVFAAGVTWAADPPSKSKQLEPGLLANYAAGDRKVTRIAFDPNFTLAAGESIHPQVAPAFTLTYDGLVRILQEGDYSFNGGPGAPADSVKITLDGKPADKVHLVSGDHPFHLQYTRPAGPARFQLTWLSAAFPSEPVPPSVLGHAETGAAAEKSSQVEHGRILVQDLNCVACHKAGSSTLAGRPAPDLATVGSRAKPQWIFKWLENPQHFRSKALMPVVLKNEQDRRDVATYLATLEDKEKLPTRQIAGDAATKGQEIFESIGCVNCHGKNGFELNGLSSKWNSTLALAHFLADPVAVDPSGRMPSQMLDRSQTEEIAAFLFGVQKPEAKAAEQAAYIIDSKLADFEGEFKSGDAARGQTLVQSAGCVNCHTNSSNKDFQPAALAGVTDLAHVKVSTGCLAAEPPAASPKYTLSADDRAAVVAYIQSVATQPEVAVAPSYSYHEHIQQFNCVGCHTASGFAPRQTMDGVPPLSIAGQKLRPEWITAVLEGKQRVRPWIRLKMPHFGPAVVPVEAELVAVAGAGPVEDQPVPSAQLIRDGLKLAGKGAGNFSCITCHSFNGSSVEAPEQSRGPEITLMATRLRPDWFHSWLREPGRIVPSTIMPAFFAGKTPAESAPAINALWGYMSLGKGMPAPEGVTAAQQPQFALAPIDLPVVQRCYLDGGGLNGQYRSIARAVAVGLPGLTSYAFDPLYCQFCYAWTGGFVDMTKGWNGRGDTHGVRLGKPFYNAPIGSPIFIGSLATKPALNYVGYAMVNEQVEFIYTVDGIEVHERAAATPHTPGLVRTFELDSGGKTVYFAIAETPNMYIIPSNGNFESVPAPAGWDASIKARAVKITGSGKIKFSFVVTPSQDSK